MGHQLINLSNDILGPSRPQGLKDRPLGLSWESDKLKDKLQAVSFVLLYAMRSQRRSIVVHIGSYERKSDYAPRPLQEILHSSV